MLDACSGIADTIYYVELYQFQYVVLLFREDCIFDHYNF